MLMADVQHDFSRTTVGLLSDLDESRLRENYGPMIDEAHGVLAEEGFDPDARVLVRAVDVRYSGQEHTVTVSVPGDAEDVAAAIATEFTELHERQYGHTMDDPIEITTMRLRATGIVDKPSLPLMNKREDGAPAVDGHRSVYVSEIQPAVQYVLYTRENLLAGDRLVGPAVIAEHTATTVIHDGDTLLVGDRGELIIAVGDRLPGKA
jgi:N-methylhydantoinase A